MCGGFSQIVGTIFTHHQKCVLVDTQASGNNRKITAFIGGIDLCDGRYDTPEHRLFRDLDTVFKDDFHNPTYPVSGRPKYKFLSDFAFLLPHSIRLLECYSFICLYTSSFCDCVSDWNQGSKGTMA